MRIPGTTYSDTPLMGAGRFVILLHTNVNNARLTDKSFREFVRNSLPVVEYQRPEIDVVFAHSNLAVTKKVYTRLAKMYTISFGLSTLGGKGVIWIRKELVLGADSLQRISDNADRIYYKVRRGHGNSHNRTRATKSVRRKTNLRRSR